MKLQSDPTVIFAIEKQYGELNRQLTTKDLTFESDYNTNVCVYLRMCIYIYIFHKPNLC